LKMKITTLILQQKDIQMNTQITRKSRKYKIGRVK
jgi:hypothetical protein